MIIWLLKYWLYQFLVNEIFNFGMWYIIHFRGQVILAGGRFRVCPEDSAKTVVDYVMCVDFKEKNIPKIIMDATMSTLIMQDAEFTRKQIEKLKEEAVWQQSVHNTVLCNCIHSSLSTYLSVVIMLLFKCFNKKKKDKLPHR